jgi:hypothetical protein
VKAFDIESDRRLAGGLIRAFMPATGALFDDLALEFSDGAQDIIQMPPGGSKGVEPFGQRSQEHAPLA